MAKIELKEKARPDNKDFEPVDLGNGVVMDLILRTTDKGRIIRATAVKGEKEVGYGSWNEEYGKFNVNVDIKDIEEAKTVAEAVWSGIMQILEN